MVWSELYLSSPMTRYSDNIEKCSNGKRLELIYSENGIKTMIINGTLQNSNLALNLHIYSLITHTETYLIGENFISDILQIGHYF